MKCLRWCCFWRQKNDATEQKSHSKEEDTSRKDLESGAVVTVNPFFGFETSSEDEAQSELLQFIGPITPEEPPKIKL